MTEEHVLHKTRTYFSRKVELDKVPFEQMMTSISFGKLNYPEETYSVVQKESY